MLILGSGAVSRFAERSRQVVALIQALREQELWPPVVPSIVLVECLQDHAGRDALPNRFLRTCDIVEHVPEALAPVQPPCEGKHGEVLPSMHWSLHRLSLSARS